MKKFFIYLILATALFSFTACNLMETEIRVPLSHTKEAFENSDKQIRDCISEEYTCSSSFYDSSRSADIFINNTLERISLDIQIYNDNDDLLAFKDLFYFLPFAPDKDPDVGLEVFDIYIYKPAYNGYDKICYLDDSIISSIIIIEKNFKNDEISADAFKDVLTSIKDKVYSFDFDNSSEFSVIENVGKLQIEYSLINKDNFDYIEESYLITYKGIGLDNL